MGVAKRKPGPNPYAGQVFKLARLYVLDRDNWTCQKCGKKLRGRDATVDNVKPLWAGGSHDPSNLVAMCRSENLGGGALITSQIRALHRLGPQSQTWGGTSRRMPQSQAWG